MLLEDLEKYRQKKHKEKNLQEMKREITIEYNVLNKIILCKVKDCYYIAVVSACNYC